MDLADWWSSVLDARWPLQLFWSIVALTLAALTVRLAHRLFIGAARAHAKRRKMDEKGERALVGRTRPMVMLTRLGTWVALFFVMSTIWAQGSTVIGLLAGAGFLGLVVGPAAQNSLSNIIVGFTIFFQHPFDLGDWVESRASTASSRTWGWERPRS